MKYQANPVIVDAYTIVGVSPKDSETGSSWVMVKREPDCETEQLEATKEMTARYHPTVGDYWVVQSDGYAYLNPKEVFERKYSPFSEQEAA